MENGDINLQERRFKIEILTVAKSKKSLKQSAKIDLIFLRLSNHYLIPVPVS